MAEWLAKAGSQVARLAGVLALLEWSAEARHTVPPAVIGRATVKRAIALWEAYFKPHAEAVFRLVLHGPDGLARRVVRWLKAQGVASVSREDIRAVALARAVDARGADAVIARLEEAGVLVREVTVAGRSGGPRPLRWRVAAHLCQNVTANSDRRGDPDRFQRPLPPDFDLAAVIRRADARLAAEAAGHSCTNVTANSGTPEPQTPAPAQPPPTPEPPAPKNDNPWACYWPDGLPPRGSLRTASGALWDPDEALENVRAQARRSG
jgi:hypothetical protein